MGNQDGENGDDASPRPQAERDLAKAIAEKTGIPVKTLLPRPPRKLPGIPTTKDIA